MPAASPRRKPGRPRDETLPVRRREEILETATDRFARHGYPGTDVQVIADALGMGKGTVYRYFPTKEKLFLAAADRGMRLLTEQVDAAADRESDPLEQMRTGIRNYLEFFHRHPQFADLMIMERAEFKDRKKPTYFEHREVNIVRWYEVMEDLQAAGRVSPGPVRQILDIVGDLMFGTMLANRFAGRRVSPEAQADQLLDFIFTGILSDTERAAQRKPRLAKRGPR